MANSFVIGHTLFKQPPRKLFTWVSPGDRARNQIDYIMVHKRWISSMFGITTRPSTDCGSDHQILTAKIKLRLKTGKKQKTPERYGVGNISTEFTIAIKNRFTPLFHLAEEERKPNEVWEEIRNAIQTTANEKIGKRKKQKTPWITTKTLSLADERRKAKVKGDRAQWKTLNTEVSSSAREDKNSYLEGKCLEMEREKDKNSREVFKIVKEITGKWVSRTDVINDERGKTLTESKDIKNRWVEYCSKLYECKEENQQDINALTENRQEILEPPIMRSEVEWALTKIKNKKAIEIWKASGKEGVDVLWKLCNLIWRTSDWPTGWCRAIFIPLPKKGNIKECSNHRTISLIVHASKVLLKTIINRIKKKYQTETAEEQAGFVEEKGTREQIVNIRIIMEKCKAFQVPLYMCFIDYAKAFDCVNHNQLWKIMRQMGFPMHIVDLTCSLYKEQESAMRTSYGDTNWFRIERGIRARVRHVTYAL